MVAPISQIEVFSNASVLPNRRISLGVFPVNNSAQRSATLRGENFVKITFNYGKSIPIPAFAFIEYDGQLFFTKEIYRPEPKGNNVYEYNVKFVSFDNLLSKPQAYRRVVVGSGSKQKTWNEPDIEIVGTLQTIAEVVCESIKASAVRYEGVFADMLSKVEIVSSEVSVNSESKAFSFQGQKISQVLESVANDYEIDYWFEQVGNMTNGITKMVLHFCKYERMDIDPLVLSDKTRVNRLNPYDPASPPNPLKPTVSGGLDECTFSNEWSGVVQRITPFGSERNITRQQAIVDEMFVSYGKRLRLEYDHSCTIDGKTYPHAYAVKDEDGNTIPLSVDENGAVYVPGVTTGEETIEKYDDIYPRGHFRVTHVTQRGVDTQIFTVYAIPTEERNGQYVDLTDAEIDAMQADPNKRLFPIEIQDGQTLSLHFESGFLNGREFEVANKSAKMVWTGDGYKVDPDNVNAHWIACFEINPEGDNNDSPQVPYGNMVPRGKLDILGYEGDMFAIFNMDMPPYYKESAMNELAQKAYDEITAILSTRPEVKCKGNEEFFMRQNLCLGLRVKVTSDLFGEGTEFVSRVTNYSHSLSRPNSVDFRLCSSRVQGSISVLKGAIADQTQAVSGVQQTARSLSRRAFRDSQEMIGMLQSIIAEMMVVGVERNQFSFTMGIECLESAASPLTRKFSCLRITAGEIQHTQEPYIKDNWEGHYTVDATTLYVDKNNHSIGTDATEEIRNTPYYLYAVIDGATGKANMELWAEKKDGENDEAYLLLGILSSEFLDGTTSLRVFNRSNGFTQIAGGTITTEQLQDPTRQLIIDMSSNPPRIIARNGAEIIGNIKFKASDTMTADKQLEALGLGVNEAKGAAEEANAAAKAAQSAAEDAQQASNNAQTAVNNVTDDDIISGGTEKANLKREWQAIAGANLLGNTDGSYFKALSQATKYSVNATSMNGFFGALKYAMEYILQSPNADTHISAGIPTSASSGINTRDNFNLLWKNYYDAEIVVLNAVSDKIKSAADAAQATADGLKWTNILKDKNIVHQDGGQKRGFVYTLIYSSLNKGTYIATRTEETVEDEQGGGTITGCLVAFHSGKKPTSDFSNSNGGVYGIYEWGDTFTAYTPIDLYACMQSYDILDEDYGHGGDFSNTAFIQPPFTWSIKGINLVTHTQDANTALDYLRAAITDGSTEIAGGLMMTNVLMLKNLQGAVTAGMSGLTKLPSDSSKSENVLMWGGGTYEDAYNAAESADYYKKDSATPITTLLKKDGTGKIGIFKISDTQAIIDVPNQGKVLIDASSSNGGIFIRNNKGENKISIKNGVLGSDIIPQEESGSGSKSFSFSNVLCSGSSGTCTTQTSAYLWTNMLDTYSGGTNTIKVTFENVSFRQMLRYKGSTPTGNTTAKIILRARSGSVVSQVASKTLTLQNVTSGSNYVAELTYQNFSLSYTTNSICTFELYVELTGKDHIACLGDFMMNGTVKWSWSWKPTAIPQTVIGTDGFATVYDSGHYFMVRNNSNGQQIFAKGLSTTKGTSGSGELYVSKDFIDAFKALCDELNAFFPSVRTVGNNSTNADKCIEKVTNVKNKIDATSIIANS